MYIYHFAPREKTKQTNKEKKSLPMKFCSFKNYQLITTQHLEYSKRTNFATHNNFFTEMTFSTSSNQQNMHSHILHRRQENKLDFVPNILLFSRTADQQTWHLDYLIVTEVIQGDYWRYNFSCTPTPPTQILSIFSKLFSYIWTWVWISSKGVEFGLTFSIGIRWKC